MVAVELFNFNDNSEQLIPNYIRGKEVRSPHTPLTILATFVQLFIPSAFYSFFFFFFFCERNQTNHRLGVDADGMNIAGMLMLR
jgi:hypothetical protein